MTGRIPFSLAEWMVAAALAFVSWRLVRFVVRAARVRGYLRRNWLSALRERPCHRRRALPGLPAGLGAELRARAVRGLAGLDASPPRTPSCARCAPTSWSGPTRCAGPARGLPGRDAPAGRSAAARWRGRSAATARRQRCTAVLAGRSWPGQAAALLAARFLPGDHRDLLPVHRRGQRQRRRAGAGPALRHLPRARPCQRGFAREDEAGYVGYLACRFHPDGDFRTPASWPPASTR